MQPILRPCSYTPTHPRIHAITYRGSLSTPIRHSLVELDPSGCVYEIEVRDSEMIRGRMYASAEEFETAVRQTSRRLWMHASSIRTEAVVSAAAPIDSLYADFTIALSSATAHHSTSSFSMDTSMITSTAIAYHSTALMYADLHGEPVHADTEATNDTGESSDEEFAELLEAIRRFDNMSENEEMRG